MSLKAIVEKSDTKSGKIFDLSIQILIVLSLVAFSIETLPDLSLKTRLFLRWFEIFTVSIFTAEYLLRLLVADRKLRFVFSFYGLIDLIAILPFYVARGVDLRSVRVFRLFRLLRILKVLRFGNAVDRFRKAFQMIRAELTLFVLAALMLIYVTGVGIYYFENPAQPDKFSSIFHSLWWAVISLTTVGYGDVYPITTGGKIFTTVMLMIGLGVIAVPTGLISSAMTRIIAEERE